MTEAQIIETCPRCDTIIEEDTADWYSAHDEEFEHEHYVYEQALEANADESGEMPLEDFEAALSGAQVVDTCPTCGTIIED